MLNNRIIMHNFKIIKNWDKHVKTLKFPRIAEITDTITGKTTKKKIKNIKELNLLYKNAKEFESIIG